MVDGISGAVTEGQRAQLAADQGQRDAPAQPHRRGAHAGAGGGGREVADPEACRRSPRSTKRRSSSSRSRSDKTLGFTCCRGPGLVPSVPRTRPRFVRSSSTCSPTRSSSPTRGGRCSRADGRMMCRDHGPGHGHRHRGRGIRSASPTRSGRWSSARRARWGARPWPQRLRVASRDIMRGDLTVQSTLGKGSTFTLRFQCGRASSRNLSLGRALPDVVRAARTMYSPGPPDIPGSRRGVV